MRRILFASLACPIALGAMAFSAPRVSAHYVQQYPFGSIALGWQQEPAYIGIPNAVEVVIHDVSGNAYSNSDAVDLSVVVKCCGPNPSVSSSNDLELSQGKPLPLSASFDPDTGLGTVGQFLAPLIPTTAGDYTFVLSGKVGTVAVSETKMAGSSTFAEIDPASSAEFPSQVPSNADLSTKITQIDARNASSASDAKTAATAGIWIGVVGAILGVAALLLSAIALRRSRQ